MGSKLNKFMKIVVQKFGGTSMATPEKRKIVISKIKEAKKIYDGVVVVVSAMGRLGDPYSTDTLLSLIPDNKDALSPRELDFLMACGENISSAILSLELTKCGLNAVALTGGQAGIITDSNFNLASVIEVKPDNILKALEMDKIVVVSGFQGITYDGEITTLGRGGSDTTASVLGVALKAEKIEIFTDVEGIMTADPKIVPNANIISEVTYYEVCEMAHLGAKIIHPKAVEIAMDSHIPLYIRSTFSENLGTLVSDTTKEVFKRKNNKVVTALAHIDNVVFVKFFIKNYKENNAILEVFEKIANEKVSLDMIHVSPEEVCFIISQNSTEKVIKILSLYGFEFLVEEGFTKISVIGAGMRGVPGVMAKVIKALNSKGISIYHSSDSHTSISCLVKKDKLKDSLLTLHEEFNL